MVLKPRAEAPQWDGFGDENRAAKCLKHPPTKEKDLWFDQDELAAAAVCNGNDGEPMCPIRNECLVWALLNNEKYGVWGGMLPHDRLAQRLAKRLDPYLEWMWHPPTPNDQPLSEEELASLDLDLEEIRDLEGVSPMS